jgi:hypothetical protein
MPMVTLVTTRQWQQNLQRFPMSGYLEKIKTLIYHDPYANGGIHKGVALPSNTMVDWLECEYACCLSFPTSFVQNN